MKWNFVILGLNNGEYKWVIEELRDAAQINPRGLTFAQSCPSLVFADWAPIAAAFRGLGISVERIAKIKRALDSSPDHEFIVGRLIARKMT